MSVDQEAIKEWVERKRAPDFLDIDFYNQYFMALADSIEKSALKPEVKERFMEASLSVLLGVKIGSKGALERPSPRGGEGQFAMTTHEFETRLVSVKHAVLKESAPSVVGTSEMDAVDRELLSVQGEAMATAYEQSGFKPVRGSVANYRRSSDGQRSR